MLRTGQFPCCTQNKRPSHARLCADPMSHRALVAQPCPSTAPREPGSPQNFIFNFPDAQRAWISGTHRAFLCAPEGISGYRNAADADPVVSSLHLSLLAISGVMNQDKNLLTVKHHSYCDRICSDVNLHFLSP